MAISIISNTVFTIYTLNDIIYSIVILRLFVSNVLKVANLCNRLPQNVVKLYSINIILSMIINRYDHYYLSEHDKS